MSSSPAEAESGPDWFAAAVGREGRPGAVDVAGVRVDYRAWGPVGAPVVVLVHGGAAHGGWWDHVAPLLAGGRRVVAVDLSGHGSSGAREHYDFPTWADEIVAVGAAEGSERPFVVGHSMGAVAALTCAYLHVDRVAGTVLVDPPEWLVVEGGLPPRRGELPPRRTHRTRELAEARFRARPPDPSRLPFVERHVAARSVHRVDGGWTWRFDHRVTLHDTFPHELWGREVGAVVVVVAERSLLTTEQAVDLGHRLDADVVTVHDSGHHVMLDQPLALAAVVDGALAAWRCTQADAAVVES